MGTFPIRYLGVPLSPGRLKATDNGVQITKVKARMQNWKSKFLSFGGRRQLVISVLQSLKLYWMAIFVFPSAVIHELDSCFCDFLWAQGDSSKGRCKVAWSLLCRPRTNGGLGFKQLTEWNRALVAKNVWVIVSNRDSLWVRWVKRFSLKDTNIWVCRRNTRWSWILAKILDLCHDMRRFVMVRVGNGLSTNAWEDAWLACGPFANLILSFSALVLLILHFHDG